MFFKYLHVGDFYMVSVGHTHHSIYDTYIDFRRFYVIFYVSLEI